MQLFCTPAELKTNKFLKTLVIQDYTLMIVLYVKSSNFNTPFDSNSRICLYVSWASSTFAARQHDLRSMLCDVISDIIPSVYILQ